MKVLAMTEPSAARWSQSVRISSSERNRSQRRRNINLAGSVATRGYESRAGSQEGSTTCNNSKPRKTRGSRS